MASTLPTGSSPPAMRTGATSEPTGTSSAAGVALVAIDLRDASEPAEHNSYGLARFGSSCTDRRMYLLRSVFAPFASHSQEGKWYPCVRD